MKTIVITGGTSGIGAELVNYFGKNNYTVIFTGRNVQKANALKQELGTKLYFYEVDFAQLSQVKQVGEQIKKDFDKIDVLINNAGVWEMEFKTTPDGIETNFAVNHLAPVLFTLQLLPNINTQKGRIINTSSGAHRRNILDFEDIEWRKKPYDGVATYSQSKLCNLLFSLQLSEIVKESQILVNTVHPGYVKTGLFQNMGERSWSDVPNPFEGARSAIFAAEDETIITQSNLYIFKEGVDSNLSSLAKRKDLADQLWSLTMNYLNPFLR